MVSLAKNFSTRISARFSNSFFPYCYHKWITLDENLKKSSSLTTFKSTFLKGIRPQNKKCFNVNDKNGIKILTKLRVEFSDLRAHRFRHNFNCLSPICRCEVEDESNIHYLTVCDVFSEQRINLFASVSGLIPNFNSLSNEEITQYLLYGIKSLKDERNMKILKETISFIVATKRFDKLEAFNET